MNGGLAVFVVIIIIVGIVMLGVTFGSAKITENLAAQDYAQARIAEARAEQERAIQQARQAIEESRQDGLSYRADSRNITIASITAMGIATVANVNPIDKLLMIAIGIVCGLIVKQEYDRRKLAN